MDALQSQSGMTNQVCESIIRAHRGSSGMAVEKFESALKKLEEVVKKLEGGELSLEDSLKAFEEGVKQASFCSAKLNEAEKRVELLLKQKDGSFTREEFRPED
jgi:exodeoxyribonuclease VII small subunit